MQCPECGKQVRMKMTGAVCDNYPCTWSTHDVSTVKAKPIIEDGKGNIDEEVFPDDDPSFQYHLGW